jgi:hemerythrin
MIRKKVANGIYWVDVPEADLRILCGCPADAVKHLARAGLIAKVTRGGVTFESGPNAILLSDTSIQQGSFSNLAEFPLLQMLYKQGMLIPGHPNNTGRKPLLIGLGDQVRSQAAYFFRGNYGLDSVEEITAAGVDAETARELFRVKKWFAFDRIRPTEELVDMIALDAEAVPLAPGVGVRRKGFNRYEFIASGGSVEVDLALEPGEEFEPSYKLPPSGVKRERFSVIHVGEGDGWDPRRPCMGSIICSDGRLYLVDAGPHITRSLDALGLAVGDIEGIFHTHAHDDHFAGLTSLVRSERRLAYFAVPAVRASVQKKLAALMRIEEQTLYRFFDVHDLREDEWNPVGALEVRPVYSPHPVETTVLFFRSGRGKERRTYAHFADIASREVIRKLAEPARGEPALTAQTRRRLEKDLNAPTDLKKIDGGGGLIHGNSLDYAADTSGGLLLSHGVPSVPAGMGANARIAAFGSADVLIAGDADEILRRGARDSLAALFPAVHARKLETLAAFPIRTSAHGTVVEPGPEVLLVIHGAAEETDPVSGEVRRRRAGAFIGAPSDGAAAGGPAAGARGLPTAARPALRAVGELAVLVIPPGSYDEFDQGQGGAEARRQLQSRRGLLSLCPVFSQLSSEIVLNAVAASMKARRLGKGEIARRGSRPELSVLASGEVDLVVGAHLVECIRSGGFWGEERLLDRSSAVCEARAATDCTYYVIPAAALDGVPLVQWTLQESFERRMHSFRSGFRFEWSEAFRVNVRRLDDQHRTLFAMVNDLSEKIGAAHTIAGHDQEKKELLRFTRNHFASEEKLLEKHRYPRLAAQRKAHAELLSLLERFLEAGERRRRPRASTAVDYLKDWLIRHTLLEDLQYRTFFARKGVK